MWKKPKSSKEKYLITIRNEIVYVWKLFGWTQLDKDLPFYSPTDQNDLSGSCGNFDYFPQVT